MEIGKPVRVITVEPVQTPVPQREPVLPDPEPVKVPQEEPVKV